MPSHPDKAALRSSTLEQIRNLSDQERSRQEAAIQASFPEIPGLAQATTVLLYVSTFPEEIDTRPLLEFCQGRSQRVVRPRILRKERQLRLQEIQQLDTDLQPGPLGIPEPAGHCPVINPSLIDWVLVPGLAFDCQGSRLGRGGGFYDRLLPHLPAKTPRWALALTNQLHDHIPMESHDIPIHGIVHPGGLLGPMFPDSNTTRDLT